MPLGPGAVVGTNIVLERELGEGAMGTVWLATNRALGSQVAVKVLQPSAGGVEMAARFAQEARAAAQLDSPHVVRIFDYGLTEEGEPFIVMELLRGRDLREHLETVGPLSLATAASILRQLCRALSQAHERGLIHRDIKPANVFLLDPDGEPFAKVLDFGVAKLGDAGDLGMTSTGALMGTPYYMSPEQFVDPRRIDHRSDLWSLAVVVYGCLVGKLPFLGETVGALSLAVHRGEFPLPSQFRPDLPPAIDAFFARALRPNPAERFGSAAELADAFDAAGRASAPASSLVPVSGPFSGGGDHPSVAAAGQHPSAPFSSPLSPTALPPPQSAAGQGSYASPASAHRSAATPHAAQASLAHPQPLQGPTIQSGPYPQPAPTTPAAHLPTSPSPSEPFPTPPAWSGAAPPAKRSPWPWLGAALALVGLLALAAAMVVPRLNESRSAQVEDDEPSPKKKKTKTKKERDRAQEGDPSQEDDDRLTGASEKGVVAPPPKPTATTSKTTGTTGTSEPPQPTVLPKDDKPEPPATISDATGFSSKIASCWSQRAGMHSGYGGQPSSATVSFKMSGEGAVNHVAVSGPASQYGSFKDCVVQSGLAHANGHFGSREAGKTVVASAGLPACEWDKGLQRHRCGG